MVDEELPHFLPDFTSHAPRPAPASGAERQAPTASAPSAWSPAEPYSSPVYAGEPTAEPEVVKSGFGESTEGLKGSNAALTLVRGLEGKAVRVTRANKREGFAFYAAKRVVTRRAGAPYKARAYIKTTSPGMYLCLRVEERGGGIPRTTERCAPARAGWRRVALKGKAAGKGHKLVVSIHVIAAGGGTSFDVDGFRLAD